MSDALFEMAQTIRRSHCDRSGREHECVGVVTIKRGEVCLDCPLCGVASDIPGWFSSRAEKVQAIFEAAGISWSSLDMQAKLMSVRKFGELCP